MLTESELQQRGWTFDVGAGTGSRIDGATVAVVADSLTLFFLARAAASLEGDDLATAPITDDLIEAVIAEQLAEDRAAKAAEIQRRLVDADVGTVRAYEEGGGVAPARIAYKEALRELLLQVAAATNPAAIQVPGPPPWVPATS